MATGVLDLLMKKWFNKLAHVTIGAWVAGGVNDPRFRHGAYAVGAAFLAYQVVEAWRSGVFVLINAVLGMMVGLALAARLGRTEVRT